MIFGKSVASPRTRRSGNIYSASPALSLESVDLGRRRSLSLDDLGIKGFSNEFSSLKGLSLTEDNTDEELEDLPSQEESPLELFNDGAGSQTEPEVSSLSTIREASPINSVEEWSPSPAEDEDNQSQLEIENNKKVLTELESAKSKSLPKGFVHNYLAKWKNMIKK